MGLLLDAAFQVIRFLWRPRDASPGFLSVHTATDNSQQGKQSNSRFFFLNFISKDQIQLVQHVLSLAKTKPIGWLMACRWCWPKTSQLEIGLVDLASAFPFTYRLEAYTLRSLFDWFIWITFWSVFQRLLSVSLSLSLTLSVSEGMFFFVFFPPKSLQVALRVSVCHVQRQLWMIVDNSSCSP